MLACTQTCTTATHTGSLAQVLEPARCVVSGNCRNRASRRRREGRGQVGNRLGLVWELIGKGHRNHTEVDAPSRFTSAFAGVSSGGIFFLYCTFLPLPSLSPFHEVRTLATFFFLLLFFHVICTHLYTGKPEFTDTPSRFLCVCVCRCLCFCVRTLGLADRSAGDA